MKKINGSEEKFRNIFDDSPIGIELYDREGKILDVNKASMNIFGISDIKKISNYNFFKDPNTPENIKENLELGKVSRFEKIYDFDQIKKLKLYETSKNGKIYHDVLVSPVFLEGDKNFSHFIVQVQDITLKKLSEQKLKESEEKFRILYENIAGGTLIVGEDYIIKDVNNRTCEITGYTKEELIGQLCDILCPKGSESKLCPIWEEGKENFRGMDTTIKCKDGRKNPILKNAKKIILDGSIYILENFQDIYERNLAEKKLKESEIKYRLAYNRAEFYKDLFAHDMNNILHNILSSIELYSLYRKDPEKLDKGEDLLSIIETQAKRGAYLISNVQKLSKLEQTEIQTKKIDLYEKLEKAIRFIKDSFQDRIIHILIEAKDENLYVRANELLLDVFENILMNSVKYNHNNSVLINIIISKENKDEDNYIKLQFLDNGIGIPDSKKKAIFQRSYGKNKNLKGMGIGLSLVKNIIYSYNGYITVEDKERGDHSKGSNFIIYIPETK